MAKKKKYYVVWQGVSPGVYDNWNAAQQQIKGYPDAKFKSFKTEEEARRAFQGNYEDYIFKSKNSPSKKKISNWRMLDESIQAEINLDAIAVDAACSGNPGLMEYQGVEVESGLQLFHFGPAKHGTNNIGEFLGLVHGLAYLQLTNEVNRSIYTDSRIAIGWVKKKKAKTTIPHNPKTAKLHELIRRAENWLESHTYKNEILKWDTDRWGEIPADFGRK